MALDPQIQTDIDNFNAALKEAGADMQDVVAHLTGSVPDYTALNANLAALQKTLGDFSSAANAVASSIADSLTLFPVVPDPTPAP